MSELMEKLVREVVALRERVNALEVLEAPAPISDHGALSGLDDDDHPQYLLTSQLSTSGGADKVPQLDGDGHLDIGAGVIVAGGATLLPVAQTIGSATTVTIATGVNRVGGAMGAGRSGTSTVASGAVFLYRGMERSFGSCTLALSAGGDLTLKNSLSSTTMHALGVLVWL